jgi:hypothetical protein
MRYSWETIVQYSEFETFRKKLSESGQKSVSCILVQNAYTIASNHYSVVKESLRHYREASGQAGSYNKRDSSLL